jgi:hypothetical protein
LNVVVFCGPTVDNGTVQDVLKGAEVLPPVSQGDVYRVALRKPTTIAIIDGYFEQVPSVWHKEILWAMCRGIYVFGAASMGALRAAELESFGMVGKGEIFEACRAGLLDDDDVAIVHGPAETGYLCASDAMVNIRATLRKAASLEIICPETLSMLERIAKSTFYAHRTYAGLLEQAGESVEQAELARLRTWITSSRVDQKREDALELLRSIRDFMQAMPGPKRVSYSFEETLHWEILTQDCSEAGVACSDEAVVLAELRKDASLMQRTRPIAVALALLTECRRQGDFEPDAEALRQLTAEFCVAHGLREVREVDDWLVRNRSSIDQLRDLIETRARFDIATRVLNDAIDVQMLDALRWTGEYPVLLARGRANVT